MKRRAECFVKNILLKIGFSMNTDDSDGGATLIGTLFSRHSPGPNRSAIPGNPWLTPHGPRPFGPVRTYDKPLLEQHFKRLHQRRLHPRVRCPPSFYELIIFSMAPNPTAKQFPLPAPSNGPVTDPDPRRPKCPHLLQSQGGVSRVFSLRIEKFGSSEIFMERIVGRGRRTPSI